VRVTKSVTGRYHAEFLQDAIGVLVQYCTLTLDYFIWIRLGCAERAYPAGRSSLCPRRKPNGHAVIPSPYL